jgi:hypothetical protein
MTKWLLIFRQHYSENTPEYGHGDYPDRIPYIGAVLEAETIRKAQNKAKKIFPNVRFGGMFSPMLIQTTDKHARLYTKPADPRLGHIAAMRHSEALAALMWAGSEE